MSDAAYAPLLTTAQATDEISYGSTTSMGIDQDEPVEGTEINQLSDEARIAADREHDLTFVEAVSKYPAAAGWAMFFSLGVIMYACSFCSFARY